MEKEFIIVTTGSGRCYARKIASSLHWINIHVRKYRNDEFVTKIIPVTRISELGEEPTTPTYLRNTIIHARAAYPNNSASWMAILDDLEDRGYRIINRVDTLKLTSDKLRSAQLFQQEFNTYPRTFEVQNQHINNNWIHSKLCNGQEYVVKPYTSLEQGRQVQRFYFQDENYDEIKTLIREISSPIKIIQEFVNYTRLYRVIVIGGHALPYSFMDVARTGVDWKVSVCLNHNMTFVNNPEPNLLRLAEQAQRIVGGDINFVDVFKTNRNGEYIISEINTACNLNIHERKARQFTNQWNIHYRIARYLVEKMYEQI